MSIKFSALTAATAIGENDIFPFVPLGGASAKKVTFSALREAIFALEATFGNDVAVEGQISCNSDVSSGRSLRAIVGTANYSALYSSGYSLTGSSAVSLVDLAGTWNTTGTPTALKLNITDTASNVASLLMDLRVGGASKVSFDKAGGLRFGGTSDIYVNNVGYFRIGNGGRFVAYGDIGINGGSASLGSPDVLLTRDAANTLALRNNANAQGFNLYNTYTDASNYERGSIKWTSNILTIGVDNGVGTGSNRALRIRAANGSLYLNDGNKDATLNSTGFDMGTGGRSLSNLRELLFTTDNTYDIGASGANRPRNLFLAGYVHATGLPAADPGVPGVFWNDAGTVKISI